MSESFELLTETLDAVVFRHIGVSRNLKPAAIGAFDSNKAALLQMFLHLESLKFEGTPLTWTRDDATITLVFEVMFQTFSASDGLTASIRALHFTLFRLVASQVFQLDDVLWIVLTTNVKPIDGVLNESPHGHNVVLCGCLVTRRTQWVFLEQVFGDIGPTKHMLALELNGFEWKFQTNGTQQIVHIARGRDEAFWVNGFL